MTTNQIIEAAKTTYATKLADDLEAKFGHRIDTSKFVSALVDATLKDK